MRFISPSFLVVTVLMSLMPWVEVRCGPRGMSPSPFTLSHPVVDQNAFQIAIGEVRYNRLTSGMGGDIDQVRIFNEKMQMKRTETRAAPLIWMVLGCALLGVIVGYAVPNRKPRLIIMVVATLGASGAMLIQGILGFPLLKDSTPEKIMQFLANLGINERDQGLEYSSGFTYFFYLAVVGLAGGLIGVLVDFLNPAKPRPPDDDDRPRRRSPRGRPVRDDDEDEIPGPPPRRRPVRDEDDRPPSRPDDDRIRP